MRDIEFQWSVLQLVSSEMGEVAELSTISLPLKMVELLHQSAKLFAASANVLLKDLVSIRVPE